MKYPVRLFPGNLIVLKVYGETNLNFQHYVVKIRIKMSGGYDITKKFSDEIETDFGLKMTFINYHLQ